MRQETVETGRSGTAVPQPVERLELVSALSTIGLTLGLVFASLWLVLE